MGVLGSREQNATKRMPLILAVDDEPNVLGFLSSILASVGYEMLTATDGDEALALIEEKNPEVVLLDILMPGKPGIEVIQELVKRHRDIAIVVESGVADEDTQALVMRLGAFAYLTKPFGVDDIIRVVERALEKTRQML